MTKPIIGFIGLGLMGSNMVENLQKKGFEPIVMDLNKDSNVSSVDVEILKRVILGLDNFSSSEWDFVIRHGRHGP